MLDLGLRCVAQGWSRLQERMHRHHAQPTLQHNKKRAPGSHLDLARDEATLNLVAKDDVHWIGDLGVDYFSECDRATQV